MNKLTALFVSGVVCAVGSAQAAQQYPLANQSQNWPLLKFQSSTSEGLQITNSRFNTPKLRYELLNTKGIQQRFLHYQVYVGQWPVLDSRFVVVKDEQGKVTQGLGKIIVADQHEQITVPKRFHLNDTVLKQQIITALQLDDASVHVDRAYQLVFDELKPVLQVRARHADKIHLYVLDAATLKTLKRENGLNGLANDTLVSGGGIGGNEKLGGICYSPSPNSMTSCLQYQFDSYTDKPQELVFNDANAAIFSEFSGYPFVVTKSNETCYLENPYVQTIDYMSNQTEAASYTCSSNHENFDKNTIDDSYLNYFSYSGVNDAHFNGGLVMQYYHTLLKELFNQDPDCQSGNYCLRQLKQKVGNNSFGNIQASWDNEFVNYGTGNYGATHYYHTTLSIVAHEASHAITYWNSGLGGNGQDGAINEAFSDMASVALLDYLSLNASGNFTTTTPYLDWTRDDNSGHGANRKWWYGWDVLYQSSGTRFFEMPSWDGKSIDHFKDYQAGQSVYATAGVLRKAFYELVKRQGWSIQDAFKLFLKANVNCFFTGASIEDAGYCLLEQADSFAHLSSAQQVRKQIDETLHSVGIVAQTSGLTTLEFGSEIKYDTIRYDLSATPADSIEAITVNWGDADISPETWLRSSGTAIYPFLQRELQVQPGKLLRLNLQVQKTNGDVLHGFNHFYSREVKASCGPQFSPASVHTTSVALNEQQFTLAEQAYQSLLDNTVTLNRNNQHSIELGDSVINKKVTVLVDVDRNGVFSSEEMLIDNQTLTSGTVTFSVPESISDGVSLIRVAVGTDYAFYDTCGYARGAQAFDIKVNIETPELPLATDFSYEVLEGNQVKFTNTSTVNRSRLPTYFWQFGEAGKTSTDENPGVITYSQAGKSYDVTLKVTYNDGTNTSDEITKTVAVPVPSCTSKVMSQGDPSAFYVDKLSIRAGGLSYSFDNPASGYNADGFDEIDTNLRFNTGNELNIDIHSNSIAWSTADWYLDDVSKNLRFTIWLDKNQNGIFESGEHNTSNPTWNYTKTCSYRTWTCRIKASQSIALNASEIDKGDTVLRAKLEELPSYALGSDGCKDFRYGEVTDLKLFIQ
ncbi:M4 family metallopeptidase [Pseudoalteromonas sp. T1lg23B]|uniref:M4 family metallopeptidase n=1 Tax=Pseudoalteromonas sp. T1lg23B TaxID=2077097 RepID=UPI000CF620A9|nr:M4 family metallopeptidase [Pseudoalteromonas sp. T1lg23B]